MKCVVEYYLLHRWCSSPVPLCSDRLQVGTAQEMHCHVGRSVQLDRAGL